MAQRIVIDPITRIEGHLRIEASLDATNTITAAYSSGTMVRGIEIILRDGSALDIATQARSEGVRSLRESGLHKARLGVTSLEEVLAVTNA